MKRPRAVKSRRRTDAEILLNEVYLNSWSAPLTNHSTKPKMLAVKKKVSVDSAVAARVSRIRKVDVLVKTTGARRIKIKRPT